MTTSAERLKVHRRSLRLDGLEYTLLSPRPSAVVRFATNQFHDTWQIVSDVPGAHVVARLCWAMAFQRHERTMVLIDEPLLVPNPYDADPSRPIVIANSDLGTLGKDVISALRAELPLAMPSMGTVVLQTRGLDAALDNPEAFHRRDDQADWRDQHHQRRWIDGSGGLLVMAAPPPALRQWGVDLSSLDQALSDGLDWSSLDHPETSREVLVVDNLATRVDAAIASRNRLFPDKGETTLSDGERTQLWSLRRTEES